MNYSCSKVSYMTRKISAMGFLCVISFYANAQFKNIKVDQGADGKRAAEPSIVINPNDPKNVVVATSDGNINYSFDSGQTWARTKLTSPLGIYGDPVLISDDKGTMYCLHLSDASGEGLKNEKSLDQIICHLSKDGGKTWEEGSPLGYNASKDQVKPWATTDSKGNVYVTWTQFDKYNSSDAGCQSTVFISSSSNGKKWSKPVVLTQNPGACSDDEKSTSGAIPTVAADNKIYVAWSVQDKILIDRSFDGGGVWLFNDISAIGWVGGCNVKIPGLDRNYEIPNLLVDRSKGEYRGVLYLAWADKRSGENDTDVWFSRSHTYGDQWSTPLKMGDDKTGKHQYQPRMTIDLSTGFVYIVYYDRSAYEDNQTDVYLAYTDDSGANFKSVKISETPFVADDKATFGNYLSISASDGVIMPAWVRTDGGNTSVWTAVIKQSDIITATAPAKGKKKK
jgi:hypothetical protein